MLRILEYSFKKFLYIFSKRVFLFKDGDLVCYKKCTKYYEEEYTGAFVILDSRYYANQVKVKCVYNNVERYMVGEKTEILQSHLRLLNKKDKRWIMWT